MPRRREIIPDILRILGDRRHRRRAGLRANRNWTLSVRLFVPAPGRAACAGPGERLEVHHAVGYGESHR